MVGDSVYAEGESGFNLMDALSLAGFSHRHGVCGQILAEESRRSESEDTLGPVEKAQSTTKCGTITHTSGPWLCAKSVSSKGSARSAKKDPLKLRRRERQILDIMYRLGEAEETEARLPFKQTDSPLTKQVNHPTHSFQAVTIIASFSRVSGRRSKSP